MGYDGRELSVFKGVILAQNITVLPDFVIALVLVCGDRAAKLSLARSTAQIHESADSDVMLRLINDAELSAEVEPTTSMPAQDVDPHTNDWDFIRAWAQANGMVVDVKDGTVRIGAPKMREPGLIASVGESIICADLKLDSAQQVTKVTATAQEADTQNRISATASELSLNDQGHIRGSELAKVLNVSLDLHYEGDLPEFELKRRAEVQLLQSRLARIRGSVAFPGNAGVVPNSCLELNGFGKNLDGSGFVSGVRHTVDETGWKTEAIIGLPGDWYSDAERLTPMTSVHVRAAKVRQMEDQLAELKKHVSELDREVSSIQYLEARIDELRRDFAMLR